MPYPIPVYLATVTPRRRLDFLRHKLHGGTALGASWYRKHGVHIGLWLTEWTVGLHFTDPDTDPVRFSETPCFPDHAPDDDRYNHGKNEPRHHLSLIHI